MQVYLLFYSNLNWQNSNLRSLSLTFSTKRKDMNITSKLAINWQNFARIRLQLKFAFIIRPKLSLSSLFWLILNRPITLRWFATTKKCLIFATITNLICKQVGLVSSYYRATSLICSVSFGFRPYITTIVLSYRFLLFSYAVYGDNICLSLLL